MITDDIELLINAALKNCSWMGLDLGTKTIAVSYTHLTLPTNREV